MSASPPSEVDPLLAQLGAAVRTSKVRPRAIEVNVAVSVALGRARGSVSCGGCQAPLEFEGIPARTNVHLNVPFRLVVDDQGT